MKIVFRMIPHWSFVLLYLFCVIESCEKVYLTGADSFHCRCNSTNCDFLEFELPKPAEYLLGLVKMHFFLIILIENPVN